MNETETKEYFEDLKKIKETIRENQNRAMVVVNSAMILTYYEIGTIINQRKTWGSKYIENLANDLKEYGTSYSVRNLKYMSQFAQEFTRQEIFSKAGGKIPWKTLTEIMAKSSSHEEMLWYIRKTQEHGWSRAMVLNQIAMKSYERSLIEPETTSVTRSDDMTNELFKDTYVFNFIDINKIKYEKDLKAELVNHVIEFLQELGPGFTLAGKEYKLTTPTGKEFYIDLLMYHTKIHAYVVIEVKLGEFTPGDLGQLTFYVNAINELERTEGDSETIGLLLCKEADSFVAKTSLQNHQLKLAISKYKYMEDLPEYLEMKLKGLK